MKKRRIDIVIGTRPEIIKIASVVRALESYFDCVLRIIHTGQHYDNDMADIFFKSLGVYIDFSLHSTGFSQIVSNLGAFWKDNYRPDIVVVMGDTDSALAGALVASKLQIPVAHIESGLRSKDWLMPEELNRIIIDHIADYLFVTENSGNTNLNSEKVFGEKYYLGNTIVDAINMIDIPDGSPRERPYILLTMHRRENLSGVKMLSVFDAMSDIDMDVVFPVHPHTRKLIDKYDFKHDLIYLDPMPYDIFLQHLKHASVVVTDSGGVQEEAYVFGTPCLTIRENTERPVTLQFKANRIVGTTTDRILQHLEDVLENGIDRIWLPAMWDGKSGERIANVLMTENNNRYKG